MTRFIFILGQRIGPSPNSARLFPINIMHRFSLLVGNCVQVFFHAKKKLGTLNSRRARVIRVLVEIIYLTNF